MKIKNKFGQEEMVGFALIIIIVAVILLIFLSLSLHDSGKDEVEDYEVRNFLQALSHYTTDCKNNLEYFSIKKLIFRCIKEEKCLDGRETCKVLDENLQSILEGSWKTNGSSPTKGYKLEIIVNEELFKEFQQGNLTGNSKGYPQDFFSGGNEVILNLRVYY